MPDTVRQFVEAFRGRQKVRFWWGSRSGAQLIESHPFFTRIITTQTASHDLGVSSSPVVSGYNIDYKAMPT